MDEKLYMWSKFTLNQLFPGDCICCRYGKNDKSGFCRDCYRDLPHIHDACRQCGLPVDADQQCACKDEEWPFSTCVAACSYSFPMDALISQFKNAHRLTLAHSLADLIVHKVQHLKLPLPELLLPVPSHHHKLRQRGFNQSTEIARIVGKRLNIPVDTHSLECTTLTAAQKRLSQGQRALNVAGAFQLRTHLNAQRIALIDDVITTGATTKALAYLLRENGATEIQAWAIARTVPHSSF